MNSLSWLIYLADVVGAVSSLLAFVAAVAFITALVCSIIWLATNDKPSCYSYEQREEKWAAHTAYRGRVAGFIKPAAYTFAAFASLAAVFPGSGTIYAIAASEVGEDALKSETGGKAIKALNAWLDRQIADESEAGK